jgi:DNA-binding response OmpR family regulator
MYDMCHISACANTPPHAKRHHYRCGLCCAELEEGSDHMPLKFLIVEDSVDVAEVVSFGVQMTWPGCGAMIATNGAEALQSFEVEQPDLIILDISIPPPNGLDVCQRIRQTSKVPILMLSVHDATLDKVRALDLGADDYLTKPFDHLELFAATCTGSPGEWVV